MKEHLKFWNSHSIEIPDRKLLLCRHTSKSSSEFGYIMLLTFWFPKHICKYIILSYSNKIHFQYSVLSEFKYKTLLYETQAW